MYIEVFNFYFVADEQLRHSAAREERILAQMKTYQFQLDELRQHMARKEDELKQVANNYEASRKTLNDTFSRVSFSEAECKKLTAQLNKQAPIINAFKLTHLKLVKLESSLRHKENELAQIQGINLLQH